MKLAAHSVTVRGRGRPRLTQVTVELDPRVPTVVVGPNGAGKSTLLRVLAGLVRPDAGELRVDAGPWARLSRADRAAAVGWLPQSPRVEEGLTAVELVAAARFRFAEPVRQAEARALHHLEALGAAALAPRQMVTLSGGEAQRVRLAALGAQETGWWLLDEPFNHLDPSVRLDLLEVVRGRQGGLVLVTHDVSLLPWLPHARVIGLREGAVVLDQPANAPGIEAELGELLGVALRSVATSEGPRWVIAGRA